MVTTRRPGALLALAMAAVAFAGCETIKGDFMPLEVGNRWEYAVEWHGDRAAPEVSKDFIEITGKLSATRFRASELGLTTEWMKESGFLQRFDGRSRQALLRLPPHTGYRWPMTGSSGMIYYEIVGREDVRTPAGLFRGALKVTSRNAGGRRAIHYWFAPDVGLVKVALFHRGELVETKSLSKLRLGGRSRAVAPDLDTGPEPDPAGP